MLDGWRKQIGSPAAHRHSGMGAFYKDMLPCCQRFLHKRSVAVMAGGDHHGVDGGIGQGGLEISACLFEAEAPAYMHGVDT